MTTKHLIATGMKVIFAFIPAIFLISCATHRKNLIVYYSQTGNTRLVAMEIAKYTCADTLQLKLSNEYPTDFQATVNRCNEEKEHNEYPGLMNGKVKLEKYDTIYLGYPIWFNTYARPIQSFLSENDFLSGHAVIPFATYKRGGLTESISDIRKSCPDAMIVDSLGVTTENLSNVANEIETFFRKDQMQFSSTTEKIKEDRIIVGGFTDFRKVSEDECKIFRTAMDKYKSANGYDKVLSPVMVASQVVAGLNYKFICSVGNKKGKGTKVIVRVFKPLPGEGDPEVTGIENYN